MTEKTEAGKPEEEAAEDVSGTSPELTGGDGFSFEDAVCAVYAAALLTETTAPGLPGNTVTQVAVQQGSFGQPLDDLIVQGRSATDSGMTLSLQVKRKLKISAAKTNDDFRETIERAHETVSAAGFKPDIDRVGAVVGEMSDATKRAFQALCEWARSDGSPESFDRKLKTEGVAGRKLAHYEAVRKLLSVKVAPADVLAATHRLLAHFVLIRLDMLSEGSETEARTVSLLAGALAGPERQRADDLWRRLLALVRVSEGRAASFDRKTLVARLNGAYRLAGAPTLQGALRAISQESRLAVADIGDNISGLKVPRSTHVQAVLDALQSPGFVQVAGMPGSGKSVVLRAAIERALEAGPILFLKSDRLQGKTWSQYSSSLGQPGVNLEELLVELGSTGHAVLFVDGIDRVEVPHRGIILDLLNTIQSSPLLFGWSVVATVRDSGMEPLRTWLPGTLFRSGVRTVTVGSFNNEEAEVLAKAKPSLRHLLFGSESVRSVVRRPFFASVLSKEADTGSQQASSEVDLAALWWERGGYAADASQAGFRRNALVQLARAGAQQLGRRIPVTDIDPKVLSDLEADGIVRPIRLGHTAQFTHDIFFEWAFLEYLVRAGDEWLEVIRDIGEPPGLGRVVEMLSQSELALDESWGKYMALLESDSTLRSQWLRAWLAGPFSLETFNEHCSTFDRLMLEVANVRVGKLVVWYQAEKTKPNTELLQRPDLPELDLARRMLYADILGYPSDVPAWVRFCNWLLDHAGDLPVKVIPDAVSAFSVWQNLFAGYPNDVSERIVHTCLAWLYHIEYTRHREEFTSDYGTWKELDRDDELKELESSLRSLVLNAALAERELVRQYVVALRRLKRIPRRAVTAVFANAQYLARVCPAELADFALNVLRQKLPVDTKKQMRGEDWRIAQGFGSFEWDHLSVDDQFAFFPSAPTREPFHSLLQQAPDEGRRLIRELCNYAARAWRQLHRLSYDRQGTPVPVVLNFPWGKQVFWGEYRTYVGARGNFGPASVNCGLMALESWGFQLLEQNVPADEVLRQVLEGHKSVGVLAVAAALALHSQHCSEITLPIATNQRIWHWDIKRHVQDMSPANLIGFIKPDDLAHAKAVDASNTRSVRRAEIRSLATLMVLRGGELGAKAAEAIRAFPDHLPFDFVQERSKEDVAAELRRTAELWAEVGNLKNYKVERTEEDSKLLVTMENPKAAGPEFDAITARHEEMGRYLPLLNWAYSHYQDSKLKTSPTIEEAVAMAKELDASDLFETGHGSAELAHQRQAVVTAVAAIVLEKNEQDHLEWAVEVCARASFTPEVHDELFTRGAKLMHHPVLFAARGLGASFTLADGEDVTPLQALLTRLVGHPYEEVAVAALKGLLGAWSLYPDVAWAGLRLASALAVVEVRFDMGSTNVEARRFDRVSELVNAELMRIEKKEPWPSDLPLWPQPWIRIEDPKVVADRKRRVRGAGAEWAPNRTRVDTSFLQKVLSVVPIEAARADAAHAPAFLGWCKGLAQWTIERVAPSWATGRRDVHDEYQAHYYEWCRHLYAFLGKVSLQLSSEQGISLFLRPAMACHDEAFGNLCESFTGVLIGAIADNPQMPPVALELLSAVTERLLQHRDWAYAVSSGHADNELIGMVKDLFFAQMGYAGGAVRFANNNWTDVAQIIPVFEPVLRAHGSVAFVSRFWMDLCESSFVHYPVEHFVDNLEYLFGPDGRPTGWRNTQLPARLAGLIQRFSERKQPMPVDMAQRLLRALDRLVDMGDRRAAAVQLSEVFRSVRVPGP